MKELYTVDWRRLAEDAYLSTASYVKSKIGEAETPAPSRATTSVRHAHGDAD